MFKYTELNKDYFSVHMMLVRSVPPGSRVLEFGCAAGYLSRELTNRGCEVTGVEISEHAAREAGKYCSRVITGDIDSMKKLDLEEKSFDFVLLADVIEHLKFPGNAIALAGKYAGKEGAVIISVPNIAFWKLRLKLFFGGFEYEDFGALDRTHLHFYTLKTIKELVLENGLKITKIVGVDGIPLLVFRDVKFCKGVSFRLADAFKGFLASQFVVYAKPRL